jgi:hypothetical protein
MRQENLDESRMRLWWLLHMRWEDLAAYDEHVRLLLSDEPSVRDRCEELLTSWAVAHGLTGPHAAEFLHAAGPDTRHAVIADTVRIWERSSRPRSACAACQGGPVKQSKLSKQWHCRACGENCGVEKPLFLVIKCSLHGEQLLPQNAADGASWCTPCHADQQGIATPTTTAGMQGVRHADEHRSIARSSHTKVSPPGESRRRVSRSIKVDEDLWKEFKKYCVDHELELSSCLEDWVRRDLAR